jgi:acyl-CoA synthetase (NDP forming)
VSTTASEDESKRRLRPHGIPFPREVLAGDAREAVAAADAIGHPVVVKLCGDAVAHKSERGLVRVGLGDAAAVHAAATELLAAARPEDLATGVLVAPVVRGNRELIAGLATDPTFGRTIVVGIGGVLTEALADVSVRLLPIGRADALDMLDGLRNQPLLGELRGEPPVDREAVADVLVALGEFAAAASDVVSVDLNPLIVQDGLPVAVDALVEVAAPGEPSAAMLAATSTRPADERFSALFEPSGVVVAGASTHPGKFGFVSLHNLLAAGFPGRIAATNRDGATVLGIECVPTLDDLPAGSADLVFVCTPKSAVPEVLRQAAAIGVRAAFLASAGYGEAGEEGRREQADLVALCEELGILLIGPNGQGVVSTPASLCAQIVAPYPPAGGISVVSQSGNLVSSFLNWSCVSGVGIARALSAGNAAATGVADVLEYYASDPATTVALAYVEGIADGSRFVAGLRAASAVKPVVVLKGGVTAGGARAAASHTGSLATDDTTFEGVCRQFGVSRARTAEEAFDVAATFATQPLPEGGRVVVVTTVGGWGVVAADAITADPDLDLVELPDDLLASIDELLPPRWSRNNPVDLAGGETRDTVPAVLELVASHPGVDAVVFLGLGIQSNQARLLRGGSFSDDEDVRRIVAFHERQDERYARAAAEVSESTGTPILTATELAVAFPDNAGPAAVRSTGRLCYASAERAVASLGHLVRRARFETGRPRR